MAKAWTWEEIGEIERDRDGYRFVEFLKAYGIRGAVALELSREVSGGNICAVVKYIRLVDPPHRRGFESVCQECPLHKGLCQPWTRMADGTELEESGRNNLIKWYADLIKSLGRMPLYHPFLDVAPRNSEHVFALKRKSEGKLLFG